LDKHTQKSRYPFCFCNVLRLFAPVADLGFWRGGGGCDFSEGGCDHRQKHILRCIRSSMNLFFVRFCWEKSKNFLEEGCDRPIAPPPLNPPLVCSFFMFHFKHDYLSVLD
jgi:hypothetical protein